MSSSFAGSFDQFGGEARTFGDGFLVSDSVSNFNSTASDSPPQTIHASEGEYRSDSAFFSTEGNTNGPILPPPVEMGTEEGYALREWRRKNTIRLEEKEKREKELLVQIIADAEEYKVEFHKKRQLTCDANKITNREKEKAFVATQVKFHAEADKDYWKSIAELIPKEVPAVETRKGKEQQKKPAVIVIQGPKPGKRADLSRMRQILIKLKHNTPPHLKPSPVVPGAKADGSALQKAPAAVASSTEAIAVA